jgi:hypothetical protein
VTAIAHGLTQYSSNIALVSGEDSALLATITDAD